MVCGGTGCTSSGSRKIIEEFNKEIAAVGLNEEVKVIKTGCFGLCALGPIVVVYPEGSFYSMVKPEDVKEIVDEHLLKGRVVTRLLYDETVQGETIKSLNETDFYRHQMRLALRNCGRIDPNNIEEYIGYDGYAALGKVLTEMTPEEVCQTILDSGLRGRGGGGFPTGRKWQLAAMNKADQKYVCCNADEGDPGAFMDRSILEGDPHAVIEAMAIAAYAIGATKGYVYIRAEYPIAVERLQNAIDSAREYGLLGKDIFGTGFEFDLEIKLGAGAFVCGEETALMRSIEGNRGEPRPRPPFPAQKGLFGKPTILNNVETYANIPQIILNGAEWFSKECQNLNIPLVNNQIDIGVRVEVPNAVFSHITNNIYEAKLLYRTKLYGDIVRTFCMNPNGYVVTENVDGLITVNGHSYSDKEKGSDNCNFALLVSNKFTEPFNNPYLYGKRIASFSNLLGNGVICQRFGDLIQGRRTNYHRLSQSFVKPTLKAEPGDLSLVLPKRHLDNIIEMIYALDKIAPGIANYDTLLYGVEVKFYSARPKMHKTLEIENYENMYACGDGAGVTRGLAQAGASGIYVARNIIAKETN